MFKQSHIKILLSDSFSRSAKAAVISIKLFLVAVSSTTDAMQKDTKNVAIFQILKISLRVKLPFNVFFKFQTSAFVSANRCAVSVEWRDISANE